MDQVTEYFDHAIESDHRSLRSSSTNHCTTTSRSKYNCYDHPRQRLICIAVELYPIQYKHLIPYYKIITGSDLPNADT